jgi:hypothetical protein
MTRFWNVFASIALATALAPVAANATIMAPLNHIQIEARKAVSGPLPPLQRIADTFDAAQAQTSQNQTIVHSDTNAQMFPDSVGG